MIDDFHVKRYNTLKDPDFKKCIHELKNMRDFLQEFYTLSFYRSFELAIDGRPFNPSRIILSCANTLESIICCCANSNIADAFTLTRKLRDDLFFYIYLHAISNNQIDGKISSEDTIVIQWLNNELSHLTITNVFRYMAKNKSSEELIKKYNLKEHFKTISKLLNNHVHSNGVLFYNEPYLLINYYSDAKGICERIKSTTALILIVYILLLSVIKPHMITSSDYLDALEMGLEPNPNSIYFVAPFIAKFIKMYSGLLDGNCEMYLAEEFNLVF